jgi:hypothetical protein
VGNTFITPNIIARQALLLLYKKLVLLGLVYRGVTEEYKKEKKVGDTITLRRPAKFVAKEFDPAVGIEVQGIDEGSVDFTIEKHFDISFAISSSDYALKLDDFTTQVLEPAMKAMVLGLDSYLAGKYVDIPYFSGVAGSPPNSIAALANIVRVLDDNLVDVEGRRAVINPFCKETMMTVEAVHRADARGDKGTALRKASIGDIMGLDWYMSQNIKTHVPGTFHAGTPLVNGAVAENATSMNIDGGAGTETIKHGDLFTVAGVDGQFVFTADAEAIAGAINGTTFYPSAPSGGFPDNAAISIVAQHAANIAFIEPAIALATVPLPKPKGASNADVVTFKGLAMRVVISYDIKMKVDVCSLDFMAGAKVMTPEAAVRILG